MASSTAALSRSGQLFFGSLCASTFGLGCWQTQRYFEKQDLMQQRQDELALEPREYSSDDASLLKWQRVLVRGTYRHDKEILVGPRGPPPGVSMGGPAFANRQRGSTGGGGMSSGPQGYYVITPLEIEGTNTMLLMNRGWIPRQFLDKPNSWERPTGQVNIIAIPSPTEQPRFLTPKHDTSKKQPLELFWMDRVAMQKHINPQNSATLVPMLTLVRNDKEEQKEATKFPLQPCLESVGEFKVTPMIHAGYAVTWFGLAGAGVYMTRKLMTRGRG